MLLEVTTIVVLAALQGCWNPWLASFYQVPNRVALPSLCKLHRLPALMLDFLINLSAM